MYNTEALEETFDVVSSVTGENAHRLNAHSPNIIITIFKDYIQTASTTTRQNFLWSIILSVVRFEVLTAASMKMAVL
jgi:hypothetical protein